MSIDVPVELIKAASTQMRSAADQIEPLDPQSVLATLTAALPGSTSGSAGSTCGKQLRLDIGSWRTAAVGFADQMKTSADNHVTTDDNAAQDAQGLRGHLRGGS